MCHMSGFMVKSYLAQFIYQLNTGVSLYYQSSQSLLGVAFGAAAITFHFHKITPKLSAYSSAAPTELGFKCV